LLAADTEPMPMAAMEDVPVDQGSVEVAAIPTGDAAALDQPIGSKTASTADTWGAPEAVQALPEPARRVTPSTEEIAARVSAARAELDRARRSSWEVALVSAEDHAAWNAGFAAAVAAFRTALGEVPQPGDATSFPETASTAAEPRMAVAGDAAFDELTASMTAPERAQTDVASVEAAPVAAGPSADDDWWIGDPEPAVSGERSSD
jgi:hypothetical protein